MSNEPRTPESRESRTGYGQTAYKRALAFAQLGIDPASVPCIPFFRASLTRIGRLLNHPRIKHGPHARLIRPFECLQASDHPAACKVSMIEHYSHIRMAAKRRATDAIVEGSVNQNVNQLSVSDSNVTAKSLN